MTAIYVSEYSMGKGTSLVHEGTWGLISKNGSDERDYEIRFGRQDQKAI